LSQPAAHRKRSAAIRSQLLAFVDAGNWQLSPANSVCCICKESAAKIRAGVVSEPEKPRISAALGR
jgi:hypothetical protein